MVIRDLDAQSGVTNSNEQSAWLATQEKSATASPIDRLAANIIDYAIVLLPFIYLVLAPFQRAMKESMLFSAHGDSGLLTPILASIAVVILILGYQSIMVWVWGATVGKMLLGLRVRNLWGNDSLKFGQAVLRSTFWCVGWLGLGIPFLGLFSNLMRRPLHDRVADTIVVSIREGRKVARPNRHETAVVSGVYWAFGLCATFIFAFSLYSTFKGTSQNEELIANLEAEDILCGAVSDAQAEWPKESGKTADRLSVAMALYAAGTVDRHCLQAEVENLHFNGEKSPLLYLVKSFVYIDTPELSDKYLSQICASDANGLECKMSDLIEHVSDNEWPSAKHAFDKMANYSQIYPIIWAVRQYLKHNEYEAAWPYLQRLPDIRALGDFVTPARVKILWALNKREEAKGVEAAAYASLSLEAKLEVSSFMCFEKIWSNCNEIESHSCSAFSNITSEYDDALSNVGASLAYVRKYECEESKSNGKTDYARLLNKPLQEDVKALVAALSQSGTEGFTSMLDDDTLDADLAAEVSRRMVDRTSNVGMLRELFKEWQGQPSSLAWRKVGEDLFQKFYDLQQYEVSADIGSQLSKTTAAHSENGIQDRSLMEHLIVSLWHAGQMTEARQSLKSYLELFPAPQLNSAALMSSTVESAGRAPASQSDFLDVVRMIRGDAK